MPFYSFVQKRNQRRVIVFSLLAICLYIYLAYRPTNTAVQIIFRSILPAEALTYMQSKSVLLPFWAINSLPQGLWVFCMTCFSSDLQFKRLSLWWSPLLFAIGLEGFQYFGITDGTFDWVDVLFSIAFSLFAICLLYQNSKSTNLSFSPSAIMLFIGYLLVFFSDVIY